MTTNAHTPMSKIYNMGTATGTNVITRSDSKSSTRLLVTYDRWKILGS